MPSRLLREGILDSEAVDALSAHAELFYRRLMSVVDDFGRFDGRTSVLRCRLYPLKVNTIREADVSRWIAECVKAGLIVLYVVDAKPYLLFHKLGHPRAKESKYPDPPADTKRPLNGMQACVSENICAQVKTDAPYSDSDSDSDTRAAAGVCDRFDDFWKRYPRKENKPAAAKAWKSLDPSPDLVSVILTAIDRQRRDGCLVTRKASDGRDVRPHPASWLNGRRWEDATEDTPPPEPAMDAAARDRILNQPTAAPMEFGPSEMIP